MNKHLITLTIFLLLAPSSEAQPLTIDPPKPQRENYVDFSIPKWEPFTLTFEGPQTSESGIPNPFLDYRLDVTFRHISSGSEKTVPGFYACDGNAASTGAQSGNIWKVHFTPDHRGVWEWQASFLSGTEIAVADDLSSGTAGWFDGQTGRFYVGPVPANCQGNHCAGELRYVGEHFYRYQETGQHYIKLGPNSPENLLAYDEFDDTVAGTNPLHDFVEHAGDARSEDQQFYWGPLNKGANIIAALNYLEDQGMNSATFITNTLSGDGDDVWPWSDVVNKDRYNCSKLDQWDQIFKVMDRNGITLHMFPQESDNQNVFSGLNTKRKLYLRELVARFFYHLALIFNLGEEIGSGQPISEMAAYLQSIDPYDKPIGIHTLPNQQSLIYTPLLADPNIESVELQSGNNTCTFGDGCAQYEDTKEWIEQSAASGVKKWVVSVDEIGPNAVGAPPDSVDPSRDDERTRSLWPVLMAGGAGIEWYFGSAEDISTDDFRTRAELWRQTKILKDFFLNHIPFWEMSADNSLVDASGDAYCLADPGSTYLVYLADGVPLGNTAEVTLSGTNRTYAVEWYDPRSGGALQQGSVTSIFVNGLGDFDIGSPPSDVDSDWVVLLR